MCEPIKYFRKGKIRSENESYFIHVYTHIHINKYIKKYFFSSIEIHILFEIRNKNLNEKGRF